jgi:hypothetical protein
MTPQFCALRATATAQPLNPILRSRPDLQDKLREFVQEYLLAEGSKPGHSAPHGAAMAMTARS